MPLINAMPIVVRDLRSELRSGRLHKSRLGAAGTSSVVLMALAVAERQAGGFNVTSFLNSIPVAGLAPLLLFIVGLNRAAVLLTAERREGTLPLLLLTHLTGRNIIFSKLVQALALELSTLLATAPALILPLLAMGITGAELWLVALGSLNVLFFALAAGLLFSVLGDGAKMTTICFCLFSPVLIYSTPLGVLLPAGPIQTIMIALQFLNPGAPLTHIGGTLAGVRPYVFWLELATTHLIGWGMLIAAGLLLPAATRWQAGRHPRTRSGRWWTVRPLVSSERRQTVRTRLLNQNPFLWLANRETLPQVRLWLLLLGTGLFWGWITWLSFVVRGINILIVMAIAIGVTWLTAFLGIVPREASRRLVEDRNSGALELLLCTPLAPRDITRGQWLALKRQFALPFGIVLLVGLVLMASGYLTFGFGGMLDPEDRPAWLVLWSASLTLAPLIVVALCWAAMRRALVARTAGEAAGVAVLQTLGVPGFALWLIYLVSSVAKWDSDPRWLGLLSLLAFGVAPAAWAWQCRRVLLETLRDAAASRYTVPQLTAKPTKRADRGVGV